MANDGHPQLDFSSYQQHVKEDLARCLELMGCQPILFVGSGLSKRYFGGPSWDELLIYLAQSCPLIDKDFAYYKQSFGLQIDIGEVFAAKYHEWAWSTGKNSFPKELFSSEVAANAYIKHFISAFFIQKTPKDLSDLQSNEYLIELRSMQEIRPHAIVTTNYDQFLEILFPDFTAIVGQNIIRSTNFSFGEIFKIHGCVSDPNNLVFTRGDYDNFLRRKKYLSAKLLTFFY